MGLSYPWSMVMGTKFKPMVKPWLWPDLTKKEQLPHTQYQTYNSNRNGLLAQYTIILHCVPCSKITSLILVVAYLRPCVSLEWCFGTIDWSWLSSIGVQRAGYATKSWAMSFIFMISLECYEHKEGPAGSQIGPLAFNCLHTPFYTPILSPPSNYHPIHPHNYIATE